MPGFIQLLRQNSNYRYTWFGQVVSEIGDFFNNIAVFSLALQNTGSGLVITGVMLARAVPAITAGPIAGVVLDRLDRKQIMIASDVVRSVIALAFILCVGRSDTWLLYLLSGLLMFASPFFTSGRASILPTIASAEELHTANSVTQTTAWTTTAIGSLLAGFAVARFGYRIAFVLNALSFVFSAICILQLRPKHGNFRAQRKAASHAVRPWHLYAEGLRYIRSKPLIMAIVLLGVGWATGGGAAQILFSLFGELVFKRGAQGIGEIWGVAGIGLIVGGMFAHWLGPRMSFRAYKRSVSICFLIHGASYVVFSQMENYGAALFFIGLSRAAVAVSSVLNFAILLRNVSDEFRGRVFSTAESLVWSTMMLSMMGAGIASQHYSPRTIGAVAGVLSSTTGIFWAIANWRGRLPEPTSRTPTPALAAR